MKDSRKKGNSTNIFTFKPPMFTITPQKIEQARNVLHQDGIRELTDKTTDYVSTLINDQWLKYRYKLEYGELAPEPNEELWINPCSIIYTISLKDLHRNDNFNYMARSEVEGTQKFPNYGIIGGSWDLRKQFWKKSTVWRGLGERFEENMAWKKTSYYQDAEKRFESGEYVGFADGPQTIEEFESYLEELDELYRDIKQNGYDSTSAITVHIGRDGELMVGHGNHRRIIASIVGIEKIPVKIIYRHKKWQHIRRRFYDVESIEDIHDIEEHIHHPDIPKLTFD